MHSFSLSAPQCKCSLARALLLLAISFYHKELLRRQELLPWLYETAVSGRGKAAAKQRQNLLDLVLQSSDCYFSDCFHALWWLSHAGSHGKRSQFHTVKGSTTFCSFLHFHCIQQRTQQPDYLCAGGGCMLQTLVFGGSFSASSEMETIYFIMQKDQICTKVTQAVLFISSSLQATRYSLHRRTDVLSVSWYKTGTNLTAIEILIFLV